MKLGRTFIVFSVLSVLLLCTLGTAVCLQNSIDCDVSRFSVSAQEDNNYTYGNYTGEDYGILGYIGGAMCCIVLIIIWIIPILIAI